MGMPEFSAKSVEERAAWSRGRREAPGGGNRLAGEGQWDTT